MDHFNYTIFTPTLTLHSIFDKNAKRYYYPFTLRLNCDINILKIKH